MCNKYRITDKLILLFLKLSTFSHVRKAWEKVFPFYTTILFLPFATLLFSPKSSFSQGEIDSVALVVQYNYNTTSVALKTNGLSIGYRYLKRASYKQYIPFDVSISVIRHPKEERITNRAYSVSRAYVFGKLNDFFNLTFGYGREVQLVEKSELGSIGVSLSSLAGFSFGLQKPIYYQIIYPTGPYSFNLKDELFDPEKHTTDNIYSRSSFFKGISETKLIPGLFVRSSFCFNYGRKDAVLNRIEIGAHLDAFTKKVELMALQDNQQIFFSFVIAYRLGVGRPLGHALSN